MAINHADTNLVAIPPEIDFVAAVSLGCRFVTSFRAIVDQGQVAAGQWVAIHGCKGVGLSATMVANALGANVVAVDINDEVLNLAQPLGENTISGAVSQFIGADIKKSGMVDNRQM